MKLKLLCLAVALTASSMATPTMAATLDEAAVNALNAALADEYHAEAFYVAVLQKFGDARPFSNIVEAERAHAAELTAVMRSYGLKPGENTMIGSKEIRDAVPATLQEACKIGVEAEIENRDLYDKKLIPVAAGHADIVAVFRRLRDASQDNHLPAFRRCAERYGGGQGGPRS